LTVFPQNYSGAGFTGMKFDAIATPTEADFDAWVESVKGWFSQCH